MPVELASQPVDDDCRRHWRRLVLFLFPVVIAYGLLLALEGVAISWIDRWLPISTFESATRAALFVTAVLTFIRLCIIGLGVWLVLILCRQEHRQMARFALAWMVGSALVAAALLAVDLWQHMLQYGGGTYSGQTVRSILLLTIYAKVVLCYPAARLLFGTIRLGAKQNWFMSWRSVSFAESAALYLLLLILKLIVESAFVTVVSYLPFVAPFWFIPDELSRMRYFVSQGTRIVSESLGVLAYIAFFIASARLIARRASMPTSGRERR